MSFPRLKICGITNLADARYASGVGADYLGFIQHPDSPRYVEPDFAAEIIEWLYGPAPVGVFVNRSADEVNAVCERAGFEVAQLHGDETPEECSRIDRPVIKAVRIGEDDSADEIRDRVESFAGVANAVLFDTRDDHAFGGTGNTFDWSVVSDIARETRVFLAGGISAENLAEAVERVGPWGIDVSSSLEVEPGQKDFPLIDEFMDVYRQVAVDAPPGEGQL
ncbi:MAG: phosphoribosylanthranilate isomerase [Rhodothermales bacterium]|nr:phosphoribosylanthranilate isomerase [Rhodothermales bacterium]